VSGSARVSVPKVIIDQDSMYTDVEVALQDEPAWQVGPPDAVVSTAVPVVRTEPTANISQHMWLG
jgi:hypothetical protein